MQEQPTTPELSRENQENIAPEESPRVLLEILVYAKASRRKTIFKLMDEIQKQLYKNKNYAKRCRIIYICDADTGNMTDLDMKKWLLDRNNSKYHVFIEAKTPVVPSSYVKDIFVTIQRLESAIAGFKASGIIISDKPRKNRKKKAK